MTFNKKLLAGLVALAAASSAQAVTVAANDGWELGISGSVNQFLTYTDNDNGNSNAGLENGLLPAFLSFDMKAPTMNGLDIAAHISISPSTNSSSYAAMEQREVYFTVDGGFGQILAGKALGLYGSHNILSDQSLYGVGYGTASTGEATTTLGSIGLGYDYASWRSQVKWTSNDMNGFKVAFAVADPSVGNGTAVSGKPTGSLATGSVDSDNLRFEADLSYAGAFDNGSYTAWLSGMTQGEDNSDDNDTQAWTVGATVVYGGFEAMAQYSDAETDNTTMADQEWSQYMVQAGYRFAGTTLVSVNYADLEDDNAVTDDSVDKITVGVYHDINANLKLVAEYTKVEDDAATGLDQDIISLGGFVFF